MASIDKISASNSKFENLRWTPCSHSWGVHTLLHTIAIISICDFSREKLSYSDTMISNCIKGSVEKPFMMSYICMHVKYEKMHNEMFEMK